MSDIQRYFTPAQEAKDAINTQEKLLRAPIASLSTEEVMVSWSILDHIEKLCKQRKELMREALLSYAETNGELDKDSGSARVEMLGGKVTRQARTSLKLDSESILEICDQKNIDPEDAGKYTFTADQDKIAKLIALGYLTVEEVEAATTIQVTYALLVDKPIIVKQMINGGKNGKLSDI